MIHFVVLMLQLTCTAGFIQGLLLTMRSEPTSLRYRRGFIMTAVYGVAAVGFGYWVFSLE
jgi:hypothetical protein